jgi:sulfite exporter TauE/SafE
VYSETALLAWTAAALGVTHTLLGPDHYIPFVAMAKAWRWSAARTAFWTVVCGLGHVLSSVLLGLGGLALGSAVGKLEWFESLRGDVAGWLLLAFGLAYGAWGLKRALRGGSHEHAHPHDDGALHLHSHDHRESHAHAHADGASPDMTPWILFTVFVFGPCEPLIPLLIYPAAKHSMLGAVVVAGVFSAATILTMLAAVLALRLGAARIPLGGLERYSHALAGFALALCGGAVTFLGL